MIRDTLKRLSKISAIYPQRGIEIYEYVQERTNKLEPNPVIHISAPRNAPTTIDDLGLVLCNFGNTKARLVANLKALQWTLNSKPMPRIIIVDAQEEGNSFQYDAYASDRVIVLNKVVSEQSKGLFLKEALWNIGARHLLDKTPSITKLCFMDMDVEFVDQYWASEVSKSLDKYDVISPHIASYYAESEKPTPSTLCASVGYNQTLPTKPAGFQGMAFGCTTEFYTNRLNSEIKMLTSGAGDTYLWYDIAGSTSVIIRPYSLVERHSPARDVSGMLPSPKIGHSHQIAAHRDHGKTNNRAYQQKLNLLKRCNYRNFDDYAIGDDGLPVWADNISGRLMSRLLPILFKRMGSGECPTVAETMDLYEQEAVTEYGAISPSHPLVVTCLLRSGGGFDGRHVRWLKQQFDKKCLAPFTFICQSDVKIDGITTVPLELTAEQAPGCSSQIEQYRNIWPENSSVLTCDLDTVLHRPFLPHRCPENRFFMLREFDAWAYGRYSLWGGGLTYFRGDFSFLVDAYMQHISGTYNQKPRYLHTGAQEFLCMALRLNGYKPESIEPHFCCRYWTHNLKAIPEEASILAFPGNPKPWDIPNCKLIPPLPSK